MRRRARSAKAVPASVRRGVKKPGNPFGAIGSPVIGLISVEELDTFLDQDGLDQLVKEAKVPPGTRVLARRPIDRRHWFQGQVYCLSKTFLERANDPAVRSIRSELHHLLELLDTVLSQSPSSPEFGPSSCHAVASWFEFLSVQALAEISRRGAIKLPSIADLRRGEYVALNTLYGLVPVIPDQESGGDGSDYTGTGSRELAQVGRPTAVRVEQFATLLCPAYHWATGRQPSGHERSRFMAFASALMSRLCRTGDKGLGSEAFSRAANAYKALNQIAKLK